MSPLLVQAKETHCTLYVPISATQSVLEVKCKESSATSIHNLLQQLSCLCMMLGPMKVGVIKTEESTEPLIPPQVKTNLLFVYTRAVHLCGLLTLLHATRDEDHSSDSKTQQYEQQRLPTNIVQK